jgi:hypothetical protein
VPDQRHIAAAWLVLAPIAGMMTNVGCQLVLARLPLKIGHVKRQFLSFGLGGIAASGLTIYGLGGMILPRWDWIGYLGLHLGAYACLGFVFFNVINANISSLRIRMVKEYLARYPGFLADAELMRRYNAEEMLTARLERLLAGGQIALKAGRYHPEQKLVWAINGFFSAMKRLLLRK